MFGSFFKKLFGGNENESTAAATQAATTPAATNSGAPSLRSAPREPHPASLVDRPGADGTGLPNPAATNSGAPSLRSAPREPHPASLVDRPGADGTGLPNPDGSTCGFRPDGQYFITHPFFLPLNHLFFNHWVDEETIQFVPKPQPPAGLSQEAFDYGEKWYNLWERSVEPMYAFHDEADAGGTLLEAQRIIAQWKELLDEVKTEALLLGDFNGARTLMLGNNDVCEAVDRFIDESNEYLAKSVDWADLDMDDKIESMLSSIYGLLGFYVSRNEALAAFYADPTGETARQAEEEHYAQFNALRQVDNSGPEMQPIAGVSLHDYVAGAQRLHEGATVDELANILGIERPQWDQAAAEWQHRIGTHPMTVGIEYTNLMGKPHPLFSAVSGTNAGSSVGSSNSARLTTDRNFYIEVAAAMNAATEAGLDAGGYLEEHFGVGLAETGAAGVQWMSDFSQAGEIMDLIQARQKQVAKTMSTAPGIADDIEF